MMRLSLSLAATVVATGWLLALMFAVPMAREQTRASSSPTHRHENLSLFTHSDDCVACHNNLQAPSGEDVSIGSTWRSTMMANAARDPYWQAGVRRETIDHPKHSAEIQDECASCHMPMTQRESRLAGAKEEVFAHLPMAMDASEAQRLAGDGVSCTVCHQIAPDTLGSRDSFNANFVLRPTPPDGARHIYGAHNVDAGRRTIMRSASGFVQEEAPHVKQSELCASCHTLITKAFGPDGSVVGELPEQMNYQEWQHSDFKKEGRSCQSCHMPTVPGPVRIASVLGDMRDSLARHSFVGGNAYMLRLLNKYRTELGVTALPAELEATARATEWQLQHQTAELRVSPPVQAGGGEMSFDVEIRNLAGHKFPTGYPSRRTWLHVTVTNGNGQVVFESGALNRDGSIHGNDNDIDPRRYEPHYEQITSGEQVQIYEPILGDPGNTPTTGLLTATQYLKDNRLLPRGFEKATADREIGVYGAAATDGDFTGTGDRIRYRVAVAGAGPFRVDVELRYQSIGFRWAANLEPYNAAEPRRFVAYYRATAADSSVVIATATASR